ncbi:hypothetical protein ACTXT7_008219 [Hymenolepis weldensis]
MAKRIIFGLPCIAERTTLPSLAKEILRTLEHSGKCAIAIDRVSSERCRWCRGLLVN